MNYSSSPLPSADVFGYLQEVNYQFVLQNPVFQAICKVLPLETVPPEFYGTSLLLEELISVFKREV